MNNPILRALGCALASCSLSGLCHAAGTVPPELHEIAVADPATPTAEIVSPAEYVFEFNNLVPKAQYLLTPELKKLPPQLPAPLTVVSLPAPPAAAAGAGAAAAASPCKLAIDKVTTSLNAATTEAEIFAIRAKLSADIAAAGCTPAEIAAATQAAKTQTTQRYSKSIEIPPGYKLTFKVSRVENNVAKVVGTYEFTTESAVGGQWTTFYGFNYIDSGDERFFSNDEGTTPPTYTITALTDRQEKVFAPSVYFMWIRDENYSGIKRALAWRSEDVFGGLTGGLGFDFDNPTAFLGYGIGWGYNVMLTAGVVMHKEKRLAGRYSAGDVITENLTEDQLSEETYKPRAYVGIAFRFGSNPFDKSKKGD